MVDLEPGKPAANRRNLIDEEREGRDGQNVLGEMGDRSVATTLFDLNSSTQARNRGVLIADLERIRSDVHLHRTEGLTEIEGEKIIAVRVDINWFSETRNPVNRREISGLSVCGERPGTQDQDGDGKQL